MRAKTNEEFQEQARNNKKITIIGKYVNQNTKTLVKCNVCSEIYEQLPSSILDGCGHAKCKSLATIKKHEQSFLQKAHELHPSIEVIGKYCGVEHPIEVRCKTCGKTWSPFAKAIIASNGHFGCSRCYGSEKKTQEEFEKKVQKSCPTVEIIGHYDGMNSHVWARCKVCGWEWSANANHICRGHGCPECAIQARKDNNPHKLSHEQFVEILSTQNSSVIVIGKFQSVQKHVAVKCSICGHEWNAVPGHLLRGHGCPACVQFQRTSFPEQAIYFYILQYYPDAINGYRDIFPQKKMELDIFIPSIHTAIEYDGILWHNGADSENREKRKYEICKKHRIRLIRVKEDSTDKAENRADVVLHTCECLDDTIKLVFDTLNLPYINDGIDTTRDAFVIKQRYLPQSALQKDCPERKGEQAKVGLRKAKSHFVIDHLGNQYVNASSMCAAFYVSPSTFSSRIKRGWTLEQALTKPTGCTNGISCVDHLGKTYVSRAAMCKAHQISVSVFDDRIAAGWTTEAALTTPVTKSVPIVIDHNGVRYPSQSAMCRAYDIPEYVFYRRIKKGISIDKALTEPFKKRDELVYDHLGNAYKSKKEMCEKYGLDAHTFNDRIKTGWSTEEALTVPKGCPKGKKTIQDYLGNYFYSVSEMCRYHGIPHKHYTMRMQHGWTQERALTFPVKKRKRKACKQKSQSLSE